MYPFVASLFQFVKDNFKPFFFPQVAFASRALHVPIPMWIDYPPCLVIFEVCLITLYSESHILFLEQGLAIKGSVHVNILSLYVCKTISILPSQLTDSFLDKEFYVKNNFPSEV